MDVAGWQLSQTFAGFGAALAWYAPSIQHPAVQVPEVHTWPVAQLEPSAAVVQAVVLVPGAHVWQPLALFFASGS